MKLQFPEAERLDHAELDHGHKLFRGEVSFLKGVVGMEHLPPPDRIEFCLAGRSNVGKSSLINALTGRNSLARTSNTPGRTQEINFFELGETHYMVDLPGYGFAKAPTSVVAQWQELLKRYLAGRVNLRRVFLLIDSRHGAKAVDEEIMSLLDKSAVTFQVVMTKTDKISATGLAEALERTREVLQKHPAAFPELVTTSSEKGENIDQLRGIISGLI